METAINLLQTLLIGISIGGVYLLFGMGLTLIFGVIHVINFAHGAFMMLAMYVSVWLFKTLGMDPYLSVIINIPLLFILGYWTQRFFINPILDHPHLNQLLLTLGILVILENGVLFTIGPHPETVNLGYTAQALKFAGLSLSLPRIATLFMALLIALALYFFLSKTDTGKAVRAAAMDHRGAMLVGINVKRIHAIAFGIGLACVGACGSLVIPVFYATPYVGHTFLIMGFVTVIVGGLGSLRGAVISGILVGIIDTFGAAYLPGTSGRMLIFLALIIVLLIKPTGLFK